MVTTITISCDIVFRDCGLKSTALNLNKRVQAISNAVSAAVKLDFLESIRNLANALNRTYVGFIKNPSFLVKHKTEDTSQKRGGLPPLLETPEMA
jgi:NADH dehydrogenase/NADH:ubiquinone oxidoreductase subunit G